MKKKITLFLLSAICIACSLSAQNLLKLADFEAGVDNCFVGHATNDGANSNLTKEVVNNPILDAVNGSSKVLKVNYPLPGAAGDYRVIFANAVGSKTVTAATEPIPVGNGANEYRYLHLKILKIRTSPVEWNFRDSGGAGIAWTNKFQVKGTPIPPEDSEDPYYSKTEAQLWQEASWQNVVIDFLEEHENCNIPAAIAANKKFYGYMLCLDRGNEVGNKSGLAFTAYVDDVYLSSSNENPVPTGIDNRITQKSEISVVKGSTVLVNDVKGSLKLEIFNLQGQLINEVYNGIANTGAYELPALPQSVYILKATTGNGVQNIKFLK